MGQILPLTQRYFHQEDQGFDYQRGTYLIILADSSLKSVLFDESSGNFIRFKHEQGYNVKIVDFKWVGGTATHLRYYLKDYYYNIDPMLEYVLLIGDINGSYAIPSFTIPSYNENDLDVTDYPYTFFNSHDILNPSFFIGRWSIRSQEDLKKIKFRTIQYYKMDYITDASYLNNSLLVAGNYSDSPPWPVTPVMTSKWLMDKLNSFGYNSIDTAFFHLQYQDVNNPIIKDKWNDGVGIINYRGWGDANGWHKPYFHREDIDPGLNNGLKLPIVLSFVCNTGDFGNDYAGSGLDKCFGETLLTGGSLSNPKGAAAMIGPSDLDTDTRFNNIMCAVMWDEMLEGRIPELAPALHAGKQALIKEFGDLEVNGTKIVDFYHHVYGVLGDPSLPVWLGEPKNMIVNVESDLSSSFISILVYDEESGVALMDVVGSLIIEDQIIAKGLSNSNGRMLIDFTGKYFDLKGALYLNKDQYYQKEIMLNLKTINDEDKPTINYEIPIQDTQYRYEVKTTEYNWIEINHIGDSLILTDDSMKEIDIGFNFMYYGENYNKLTICSNGWVSFLPCLKGYNQNNDCNTLPYFFNNSISNPLGPYGMIAPFFDDLDDNNQDPYINVYYYLIDNSDSLVVQWDEVANNQTNKNCPDDCEKETFQLILDGSITSEVGNGEITFQYKEIHDIDDHGSTIGIESPDKNTGTEFLFNKNPVNSSELLQNGLAIKFSQACDGPIGLDECDCNGNILDCRDECGGNSIIDNCGVCGGDNSSCILGCTYFGAENYNSAATLNDGTCIIFGCTNIYSEQYNPSATNDDGSCSELSAQENLVPKSFELSIFPNPFNPVTTISFAIPEMGMTSIIVANIKGQKLITIIDKNYQPGYYFEQWDASGYASGIYFITFMSSGRKLTQKILILK